MVEIEQSTMWQEGFENRLNGKLPWQNWSLYKMNYEMTQANLIPDFSGLQCIKYLPMLTPLQHQINAATTVIEEMHGKAILADEVGLGKTIEAGLILKEYMIRNLVQKALILAPASLISQWVEELSMKFHIPAAAYNKKYSLDGCDVVVMSMDTAKKSPHSERIYEQNYDIIIIDEAHKLKNHKTQVYQFVQGLKKKFCLLLTATPIQNNIFELFYLISLLKPGHLGSYEAFQAAFSASKHSAQHHEFLQELVHQVMVRNRRDNTNIAWTKRHVQIVPIHFSPEEQALYTQISQLDVSNPITRLTLQKELCSSKEALYETLSKMPAPPEEILAELQQLTINSKAQKTVELIQQINNKVIIFTEYRATQQYLQAFLYENGITSVLFNGKFKKSKRDYMKHLFKEHAQVLIATEAGGEGINLQFCSHVINYDLPWNPMKLEQRIGRVHRLGQNEDVQIYNLAIENTIEQHILSLLYKKIDVFEQVVGELDAILTNRSKE
ncbi:DEAD/DEAH box helicase [Bacillus ndiopicus]|uniref:DEAD/DEAH box helicase n=1 Tax=Bacillus ndiopicus TaxID=1347368 RepID=UPI0006949BF1|nr:SNF2-related protein [Bacillus ndiopicus]